ncbi:uncharacterized protein At3g27210-like [Cucurbita moschata]|uniref:Uncharacterized protein At3g27210-like n=1 Tax=Cucurbita moschata TaxID=3662 RepID=A0A6J1GZB4_CUCMO|nr:uncharacterized protein At3g27210-like [Cucurbita moschata]
MGNCVLIRRDQKSDPKFKWSVGSGALVNVRVPIPTELDQANGRLCSSPPSSHLPSSPEFGKGDEMFFDSQAWLDSDNDDFFSVNGDNMPSCGSTPIWRPNAVETPAVEPSPEGTKKLLIELFRESFDSEHGSTIGTAMSNGHIGVVIMEGNNNNNNNSKPNCGGRSRSVKGKSAQSTAWCIPVPKLARSLSLSDKKKRLLSPCRGGGPVHP